MLTGYICPISLTTNDVKQCNPNCKLLYNGECLIRLKLIADLQPPKYQAASKPESSMK